MVSLGHIDVEASPRDHDNEWSITSAAAQPHPPPHRFQATKPSIMTSNSQIKAFIFDMNQNISIIVNGTNTSRIMDVCKRSFQVLELGLKGYDLSRWFRQFRQLSASWLYYHSSAGFAKRWDKNFQSVVKISSFCLQAILNHTPKLGLSKTESFCVILLTKFVIKKFKIFDQKCLKFN